MAQPASQVPVRNPAGATSDPIYGVFADSGFSNPFFYHQFADDFDNQLGVTGAWTVSGAGGGTVVHTPGDGGLALFTTGATTNNFQSIQLPAASFTLPQGGPAGKKMFFIVRLALSDITNSALVAGLCTTTATPFAGIADGVYFQKSSGGTVLNLINTIGSTPVTTVIPASAYALVNATNIDLGFYIDRLGNINAFVGAQLVGWVPQSGTGAPNAAGVPTLPVLGRCLQLAAPAVSAANLNLTLGIQTGANAAKTLTTDFISVQKER